MLFTSLFCKVGSIIYRSCDRKYPTRRKELGDSHRKVAVVTGAGKGMGRSIARTLADSVSTIIVNDLDDDAAREAAKEISNFTDAVAVTEIGDVSDQSFVNNMFWRITEKFGGSDILVNNAGVLRPTNIENISLEEWDFVVNGNLTTTFLCSKAVIPFMKERGWGRIINISSSAGKNVSTIGGPHYTAAKAGVLGLTRHMAKVLAEYGITVNAICPGLIDTDMVRSTISRERTSVYAASFPMKRLGKTEEIADLVQFLSSDHAAYITGASVDINGGDLMV